MAGERELSCGDRDGIGQRFAERTRVIKADDYPDLAASLLQAFDECGRP